MQRLDGICRHSAAAWRWLLPGAAACLGIHCSPTEIAEEQFQSRQQTCYEFPESVDGGPPEQESFWSDTSRPEGCEETRISAVSPREGSGLGAVSSGVASSGATNTVSAGAPGVGVADAGAADAGDTGGGLPASPLPAGCAEAEILERFARPSNRGGCTDPAGLGCHEDGTGEEPLLGHPGESLARLLDRQDAKGCEKVWIPSGVKRPEDSFLYQRLSQNVSEEDCEVQMPLMEEPLDPATLQCIGAWIVWVANGRQP